MTASNSGENGPPQPPTPWTPAEATLNIRAKALADPSIDYTGHARGRIHERDLIIGDVLHVLKYGTVYETAEPSSRDGLFKYKMECPTPNSGRRSVRVVVIPSPSARIKIVTVMWVDES